VFEGFEQVKDANARKRWFASTGTSVIVVMVIGGGLVLLARQQVAKAMTEKEIDVTFQAQPEPEIEKKPPPPPPPAPKLNKPKRSGHAAPATPTVLPDARPTEGDPQNMAASHEAYDELGEGGDDKKPLPPPPLPLPPPPPPVEEKIPDPISEVDTAFIQAKALGANMPPAYPESARKKGAEAVVKLKVRISATGEVTDVTLLAGDEPFAAAAIAAVKAWRYQPATDEGKPVASTRIVSIPFRLQSR
jgi:periplasmic protein TonB